MIVFFYKYIIRPMLPRIFCAWLGYLPDKPTPLWRHPEVGLIDWIFQLLFPLLLPLHKLVAAATRDNDMHPLHAARQSMEKNDGGFHDTLFRDWTRTRVEVPGRNGTVLVWLYTPPSAKADVQQPPPLLPMVLWLHGGGLTLSSARDSYGAKFATELLAQGTRVVWVAVDYRLAPEHAFPAAPHDALDALKYFVTNASTCARNYGVDTSKIHVAGTSAGGGLAAVVAAAVSREGVLIKSLLVDQPMLNHTGISPTYLRHGATTIADVSWLRWAWSVYLPNGPPEESSNMRWLVSPLLSPPGGFGGSFHPPTIIVTATADPLEDDGVNYTEALREAAPAVAVTHIRARGSHVIGLTLDRKARREMFSVWSQLLNAP